MLGLVQQAVIAVNALFNNKLPEQVFLKSPLLGKWTAQNEVGIITFLDGKRSADPTIITLIFNANGSGSLQAGAASRPASFTYRLLSKGLLEFTYSNSKPRRYSFYQSANRLSFSPYPAAKTPQESIELFCALSFIRQ